MVKMFWGITLENGKRYSQTVDVGFHVSMAALEVNPSGAFQRKVVSVMLEHEKTEFLLCSLQHDECRQQPLDLNFIEGEEITFFLNGPGTVHLTGYVLETNDDSDDEELAEEPVLGNKRKLKNNVGNIPKKGKFEFESADDDDDEDEDDDDSEEVLEDWSSLDSDEDLESLEDDDKIEETPKKKFNTPKIEKLEKPKQASPEKKAKNINNKNKKTKEEKAFDAKSTPAKTEEIEENGEEKSSLSAKKKKKKRKKKNSESSALNDSQANNTTLVQSGQNKTPTPGRKVTGGVSVVDSTVGSGPIAKKGRTVRINYVGKLPNNKIFDASKKDLFSFKLGSADVINGMNIGIEGMKVGGKRTITIPPAQGYGKQSAGAIPPNSTLIFDVQLKAVN